MYLCVCACVCKVLLFCWTLWNSTYAHPPPLLFLFSALLVWRYCSIAPDRSSSFPHRMRQHKGRTQKPVNCLTLVCVCRSKMLKKHFGAELPVMWRRYTHYTLTKVFRGVATVHTNVYIHAHTHSQTAQWITFLPQRFMSGQRRRELLCCITSAVLLFYIFITHTDLSTCRHTHTRPHTHFACQIIVIPCVWSWSIVAGWQ